MTDRDTTDTTLDERTRDGLSKVLDVLLPGSAQLPSARSIDVQGALLNRILKADPRLFDAVRSVGVAAAGSDAVTLADLESWAGNEVDSVVFALTSAYYISPQVLEALKYPGQARRPVSQATPEETYSEELLAPVRERGAIYIPTP